MHFEYDIFLSYKTSNEEVKEWINNFKNHLSKVLSQLFNKKINIVVSTDIKNSSEVMMTTGAFIAIITKDYINDSIENSFLNEFNHISKGKRIFKITKENIKLDEQTELLKQLIAYDFYPAEMANNQKITQDKFFKTEGERLYWLKVVDLAYAVYNATITDTSLNKLKNTSTSVFVAEVSSDQEKYRDNIVRELQYYGYTILPEKSLPNNTIDFEQIVIENASKSKLSIHILGESYGESMPNSNAISKVELQHAILNDVNKKTGIERLIWVNPELKNFDEKQSAFLQNLKKDIETLKGAELIQTPLEIFKTIINNKLSGSFEGRKNKINKVKSNSKSIYLINGKEDTEKVKQLQKWITNNGYDLITSDFDGKRGEIVEKHRAKLVNCDGAIVYYAHSNPQWIKMKIQDLVKAPGFGRTKPMNFTAVYSTIDEEITQNNNLQNFIHIKQQGDELNNSGLKEITLKLT